jgi:hypothetical protein
MYRVLKAQGVGANVVVENTDTKANVIIGRLNTDIVNTIVEHQEEGYTIPEYDSIWNIEVNNDCAKALASMAMKMKKPIRNQSKKTKDTPKGKIGVEVDAFDLIFNI